MTNEERNYWNQVIRGIVSDHIAYHDAIKAQKRADEAKARAEMIAKQVEAARMVAYQQMLKAKKIAAINQEKIRQYEAQQKAEEKRLQEEAKQAELERLQEERENDPFCTKVRDYWSQPLTPQKRQIYIAA